MFKVLQRILIISVCLIQATQAQEVAQAGITRFNKRLAELLAQIDTTINKTKQEVDATFDSTKEINEGMQKAFATPVQQLVSRLQELPKKYNDAAGKIRAKNMIGLRELISSTRSTISDTLKTVSQLVKNINNVAWDAPIQHITKLLEIAVTSFKLLRSILEGARQDVLTTLAEGKEAALAAAQKSLAEIDAAIEQLAPLVAQLQAMAR